MIKKSKFILNTFCIILVMILSTSLEQTWWGRYANMQKQFQSFAQVYVYVRLPDGLLQPVARISPISCFTRFSSVNSFLYRPSAESLWKRQITFCCFSPPCLTLLPLKRAKASPIWLTRKRFRTVSETERFRKRLEIFSVF